MVGLGLPSIQYSLDTMDSKVAAETLHVNDNYLFSLLKSIRYADSKGLEVIIKPTLSKKTCTADNVEKIVQFCKELENVKRCVVSIAGYSHFKSIDHYAMVKPDMEQIVAVENYVKKIAKHLDFPIYNDNQVFVSKELCNYKRFKDRSLCTANVDGFMVLPDGKVTICEELYWNPDFIIGDLNKMSILEMWNSPEAWNLWDLQQKTVPVNSPCSDCQDFKGCRLNKGVCWKFVLAAYGRENKFFPDPRCPKAPKINHHFIAD